jgi:predicted nucleic acid-binding protein
LTKKGQRIDPEDTMIAGIAITNNKILVTRDKHFDRINGLKIEKY